LKHLVSQSAFNLYYYHGQLWFPFSSVFLFLFAGKNMSKISVICRKLTVVMFTALKYKYRKYKFSHTGEFAKMLSFYGSIVKKGDLVFDVGSNNGERAIVFEKLGAKLICVEPQQTCVKLLKQYFGKNENVVIVDKACGAAPGAGEISICDEADTISSMSEKWIQSGRFSNEFHWEKKQAVEIITLDMLVEKYGVPVLCKVDVEGFETEVLKGLHKKAGVLSFEFTQEFFDDAETCMNLMDALGNTSYNFSLAEEMSFEMKDFSSRTEVIAKLKENPTADLWGDIYVKFS
jgi:FkbM family methyltransferase